MSSDYSFIDIDGYETINGVKVPYTRGSRSVMGDEGPIYLNWADIRGKEARQLTSPYGALCYAIGTGDDFHCFDHARLPDGRIILDSTINSETGSFIMKDCYDVVWPEDAVDNAVGIMDRAVEWLYEGGGRPMRHHQAGWNQDEAFWVRDVATFVKDPRMSDRWKNRRIIRDPRARMRWWFKAHALPFNPEIVRLEDPAAIVLRFGDYDSEPIGWKADDNVFELALEYMKRYGWDKKSPGTKENKK